MLYGESKKTVKINCIWCGIDDVLMYKVRPRRKLLLGGSSYDKNVCLLCDNCGLQLHPDDMIYSCINDRHDVCLNCASKKITQFQNLQNILSDIIFDVFQIHLIPDCINEIVSFVNGKLLQFEH